jgi:hypothetical protein
MKAIFTDNEWNTAIVYKGLLWWRKAAEVEFRNFNRETYEPEGWYYTNTDLMCSYDLTDFIRRKRDYYIDKNKLAKHDYMFKPCKLPVAKVKQRV